MRLAGTSQVLSTCWRDPGHTAVCYTGQNVGCAPGDTSVQTGQSHACNILPSSPQGLYIGLWASSTQVTNPGTIRFPSSYPQHRKLLHTTFGPNSSGGEKCWKHEQGKDPGKQVHLPSVLQPSYHAPEHSCTLPQEGIKSAQAVLIERALTGGRHLFCCVSFSGAVQYH